MTDASLIEVTAPAEIESIKENRLNDIVGGYRDGQWQAYPWSMERWRKARASHHGTEQHTKGEST